ncbi:MAG: hypothetical protein HQL99_15320 [Magnetococcales bacterium]|nr:hypothetical protein [Magnetococcales bacterium]
MTARVWIAEKMLQILNEHSEVSVTVLAERIERPRDKTLESLKTLAERGLVESLRLDKYRLTDAGRIAAGEGGYVRTGGAARPRTVRIETKSLRFRAWKALRMEGGKSTIPNLLSLLATDGEVVSETNLLKYFSALNRVGILSRLHRRVKGTAKTSNGFVVWAIIRNVGPKAPVWRPTKNEVYDPNTGTTYPLPPKGATP